MELSAFSANFNTLLIDGVTVDPECNIFGVVTSNSDHIINIWLGNQAILIRIVYNWCDKYNFLFRNIILLNNEQLAPALFATFKNGLAYEFAPGLTLDPDSVTQPKIYSLVARKMANLHLVRPDNYLDCKPAIWLKIQQFYDLIPDTFSDAAKQKQ